MNVNTVTQPREKCVFTAIFIIVCLFLSSCGIIHDGSGSKSIGSAALKWVAPERNEDGSELIDLAGYKVYYGRSLNDYAHSVDVGNYTEVVLNLATGTWCFAVTAYDESGNESNYSEGMCASIKIKT